MKTKVPKGLYLVPFVYVGIILVFIYLQFSGTDTFTSQVSHLTALGTISGKPWENNETISELQVFGTGIVFSLNKANPVRINSQDGLVHKAEPVHFLPLENGFQIEMTQDLNLSFTQSPENPQAVYIHVDFPEYTSVKNISLPFSIMRDFALETAGGFPVFSIQNKKSGEVTMLSLPMGGSVDSGNQRVDIPPGTQGFEAVIVEKAETGITDTLSYWFARQADLISREQYDEMITGFINRSQDGWKNSRFDRNREVWTTPDEEPGFDEKIAVALLAESMNTSDYTPLFTRVESALEKTTRAFSRFSGPFLGNIISKNETYLREEKLLLEEIYRKIAGADPLVFLTPGLYALAGDHQTGGLPEELILLAASLETVPLTPQTAVGLFRFFLDCLEGKESLPEELYYIQSLPENQLLPLVKAVSRGFFLESEPERADILLSLETGALLLRGGEILEKEIYSVLGRELINSALMLADPQGILPARIFFEDGTIRSTGVLPPEEIYPLITRSIFYPREVSIKQALGRGSWIFTSASKVTAESRGGTQRFTFSYPVNQTHYITIQGVKPFSRLQLLGINWKSDPIFQYYYSGQYYEEKTRTLYIKLKHRQPVEEVILYFDPPKPEEKPPAETPAE